MIRTVVAAAPIVMGAVMGSLFFCAGTSSVSAQEALRLPGAKPQAQAISADAPIGAVLASAPLPKNKPAAGSSSSVAAANAPLVSPWVVPTRKIVATPQTVGVPGNMICALTFDDGPHKVYDPEILKILRSEGVIATFYLLGRSVRAYPKTTQMIIDAGHEIASHSWDHKDQSKLSAAAALSDMNRAQDAFAAMGVRPRVYRPPYGSQNSKVRAAARANDMHIVRWTVDTLDWKSTSNTQNMLARVKEDLAPGGVVLLHSINPRAVAALRPIIRTMKERGCKFVTQSQWLAAVTPS